MSAPLRVRVVPVWEVRTALGKTPRCCATGCGDKIKEETCAEVTFVDGTVSYIERGCAGWFVDGHPDYGGARGHVSEGDLAAYQSVPELFSAAAKRTLLRGMMQHCPACVPEDADGVADGDLAEWLQSHIPEWERKK